MRDKKHLQWITSLACAHCMAMDRYSIPHHLSGDLHASGVGVKASDFLTMPLCDKCHRAFHEADRRVWPDKESRIQDQRRWLLQTLIHAIDEGVLVAGEIQDMTW